MKYHVWVVLFASLGIAAVVYTVSDLGDRRLPIPAGAEAAEKENPKGGEKSNGLPPLVVDKGTPLLLKDPPKKDPLDVPEGPVADNTACYCCHTNYEEEPFAISHAKGDVGCMECHGKSYEHRDDEDNVTPPDVMFPPEKIASNCEPCHDTHDAAAEKVIARWQERCPAKTDPKKIVCTDCHGQHRLEFRTVWWDKNTRKLIIRDEGQRIKVAPDLSNKNSEDK